VIISERNFGYIIIVLIQVLVLALYTNTDTVHLGEFLINGKMTGLKEYFNVVWKREEVPTLGEYVQRLSHPAMACNGLQWPAIDAIAAILLVSTCEFTWNPLIANLQKKVKKFTRSF
jgi:hypothetical protein